MKVDNFILSILKKIESLRQGIIAYSYREKNWYVVCLNDFDLYMKDKRFKALSKAWYTAGKALGIKVIFAYCDPKEEFLAKLANEYNLFLNV